VRIDLYNATAAAETTNQSIKLSTESTQTVRGEGVIRKPQTEDTTTLSSSSDSVHSLTQTALEDVPARAARVESLKQAVSSGQYQLDPAKIADALSNSDV
jgi:flagellar biosynthesis anti-sigma factor FlgM